jgi:phospholipase/carboxylesterase
MLETITVESKNPTDFCVIWLHGLGADGHDFEDIVPALNLPETYNVRFVFPHAPYRPITINMNMEMRAWYDILTLDNLDHEDATGIHDSVQAVETLIQ